MPRRYFSVFFIAVSFLTLTSLTVNGQTNGIDGANGDPGQSGTDGGIGTAESIFSSEIATNVSGEDGGAGGNGGNGVDENGDGNAAGGNGGAGGAGRSVTFNPESLATSEGRLLLRATGGDGGDAGTGGASLGNALAGSVGLSGDGGNAIVIGDVSFDQPDPVELQATAIGGSGGFGADGGSASAAAIASGASLISFSLAEGGGGGLLNGQVGTAGNGGLATSEASLVTAAGVFEPQDFAQVFSNAFGGDGGNQSNADGVGGDGANASATSSLFSQDTEGGVFAFAEGGNGGSGLLAGGNGGSGILENAATGGALGFLVVEQAAFGGIGGQAGNAFSGIVGSPGQGGDGISRLTSDDVNQIGGDSRVTVSANGGGRGGNGIASANIRDTGDIDLFVDASGGTGSSDLTLGQAIIESAVAESTGGDILIRATATGGRAVSLDGSSVNGGSVTLDNVAAGSSPTDIFLFQTAQGGRGDDGGAEGDAFSRIQSQEATGEFSAFTVARGHDTTAITDIENLTGLVESQATSEAVDVAIASTTATGGTGAFTASARSTATGRNATANSFATQTGSGRTSAAAFATGEGENNVANGDSLAIASLGEARATTNVIGGTATGTAHAESQTQANSLLFISGETGGRDGDNGIDGGSITNSGIATGSGGDRLSAETVLQAGTGGSASNTGIAGNGGVASIDFSSSQLNPGGGDTFFRAETLSGGGGSHSGAGDGGQGGKSDLRLDLVADTGAGIELQTQSNSGSGGSATESRFGGGTPLGNGGDAGDATANLSVVSDFGGDISITSRQFAFGGGNANDGRAGNGGGARGVVFARSSGGDVEIDNVATSGFGGGIFGNGQAGDAGIAFSDVTGISAGGEVQASSRADGGSAGMVSSGNGTVGRDFLTTAIALADNTIIGSGSGGFAQAQATASGRNSESLAVARTGNNAFRNIEVRASGDQGNNVETQARAQIGGATPVFFNSTVNSLEAHGSLIASPDEIFVPNGLSINGSFLSEFQANNIRDTDFVLANGLIGAGYGRDGGVGVLERSVEINFDIAIESTADDLRLGFYSPDADSTGIPVFDSLLLTVDIDGLYSESFSFSDRATADSFFSFQTLSLGSLEGFDRVDGSIRIDYLASDPSQSYRFNYLLGNAQANLSATAAPAVPEPTALGTLLALFAWHASRRRRASRA